jgi:hypothetical protein
MEFNESEDFPVGKLDLDRRTETETSYNNDQERASTMTGEEKKEYEELEKELREEKKPKKPLARVIPAFIDLIIIGA